jgi:hypothetical protein
VLPAERAGVRFSRVEQRGEFLARPGPDGWRPFTAVEHFSARPAGFVWDARIRMAPGMTVRVRDGFVGGRGSMVASVMGVYPVVSVAGTPEIDAAALQRFLAEAVWIPTALLPGEGVAWSALDASGARATVTAGATTVSVDFHFGGDGLQTASTRPLGRATSAVAGAFPPRGKAASRATSFLTATGSPREARSSGSCRRAPRRTGAGRSQG